MTESFDRSDMAPKVAEGLQQPELDWIKPEISKLDLETAQQTGP